MPAKSNEIYWLAGILEGEGSFSILENGTNALIKLAMTDLDIIERVKSIMSHIGPIGILEQSDRKTVYIINISGNLAIQWMMTIYSLMGVRRKQKIRQILPLWQSYERQYKTHCKYGHEYNEENTIIIDGIRKGCRECRRIRGSESTKNRTENKKIQQLADMWKITVEEAKQKIELLRGGSDVTH